MKRLDYMDISMILFADDNVTTADDILDIYTLDIHKYLIKKHNVK